MHAGSFFVKHYETVFSGYLAGNTAPELNMLGTSPKCTLGHVYLEECSPFFASTQVTSIFSKTFKIRTQDLCVNHSYSQVLIKFLG